MQVRHSAQRLNYCYTSAYSWVIYARRGNDCGAEGTGGHTPRAMRKALKIQAGSKVTFKLEDNRTIVEKQEVDSDGVFEGVARRGKCSLEGSRIILLIEFAWAVVSAFFLGHFLNFRSHERAILREQEKKDRGL